MRMDKNPSSFFVDFFYKTEKSSLALLVSFEYAAVLQHLLENGAHLTVEDLLRIFRGKGVFFSQFIHPFGVFRKSIIGADIRIVQNRLPQLGKLRFQTGGEYSKPHDLD